jgi:DNA-binding NarL/FixJ family response regulator
MELATATHRILLVDDHAAVTAGVERLLGAEPDFEIAGIASNERMALRLAAEVRPDVAVVDMQLPGANGLLLVQRMLGERLARAAVVYTAFRDDTVALAALIAGASDTVSKGDLGNELVDAVRAAAEGHTVVPRLSAAARHEAATRLYPRDLPILGMLMHGTPAREVAAVMRLTTEALSGRRRAMVRALVEGAAPLTP